MENKITNIMENELITIVMSAYNAQDTIERAIDSIRKQTYKNWELIIVNDASTDNTGIKTAKYVYDDRIHLYNKAVNEGAGMARRTGIEKRSKDSKYLCFIDSDDEVFEDYLEVLHNAAVKFDAEVVTCGFTSVNGEKQNVECSQGTYIFNGGMNNFYVDGDKIYIRFMNCGMMSSHLWEKVQYNGRRFVEDTPTFIEILYHAKSRVIIPYVGYVYYQNPNSLCHQSSELKRELYTILCGIDTYNFFLKQKVDVKDTVVKIFEDIKKVKKLGLTDEIRKEFKDELSIISVWLMNTLKLG